MITNPVAAADVEHIIGEFITAGKVFTALHVTVELRDRKSPAGILRHMSDISPEVRNAYNNGDMNGYQAALDSSGRFNIYYPTGTDPRSANVDIPKVPKPLSANEVITQGISGKRVSAGPSNGYPTQVIVPAPAPGYPTQVVAPTPVATAPVTPTLSGGKYLRKVTNGTAAVRTWRKGNYVETPREMLRQAGLTCGTLVKVDEVNGEVTITPSSVGNAAVQDSRHCLRLHKNLLGKFLKVTGTDGVQFTYQNGIISLAVV